MASAGNFSPADNTLLAVKVELWLSPCDALHSAEDIPDAETSELLTLGPADKEDLHEMSSLHLKNQRPCLEKHSVWALFFY